MTAVRPDVVAVLMRLDSSLLDDPNGWIIDGRPVTDEERRLALSATKIEMQAMLDLTQAEMETALSEMEAADELMALCLPYMSDHKTTVNQAIAQLPPEQRARAEHLLRHGLPNFLRIPRRRD